MAPKLYGTLCEKRQKVVFPSNAMISKLLKISFSKFDMTVLEPLSMLCRNFELISFPAYRVLRDPAYDCGKALDCELTPRCLHEI